MSFCSTKKSYTLMCGVFSFAIFIIFDQIIKQIILDTQTFSVLCNYGVAMGIVLPKFLFVAVWMIIMMFVVYFWLQKISEKFLVQLPYVLILAGGISNVIDRVLYGCVIDYIPFLNISSFNIADLFITAGAAIILWNNFFNKKEG